MSRPDVSISAWFAARADRSPHRRALTFEGITVTYAALLDRVERLAGGLAAAGVGAGDRVAFLGANQPALIETFLAANRLGAVFLPLNFRLAAPEIDFILADSEPAAIVADSAHRPVLDAIDSRSATRVCVDGTDAVGWTCMAELLVAAQAPARTAEEDDAAILMYTSGTTGRPKGVILTNGNLFWNNINLEHLYDVREDDVTLVVAPMFHIAGLNVTVFTTLFKGGEVRIHRSFDASAVLDEVERSSITTMFVVPAMLNAICARPDFAGRDLSSLRVVICGGAPVPEALLRRYADRGIGVLQGYGLTETSPAAIFLTAEHALSRIGSAGRPPLFVEVQLRTDDGTVITESGVRGEVCLRGPNVSPGYWNRPDATAEAHDADGWFHTGDIGVRDAEGFYAIVDRVKDMVITGGENVSPAEVENAVYTHPAVADVAVIGVPDERWGEAVTAVVVLRPDADLTLEQLRDHCSRSLARYKLPNRLILSDELPRNASGKVQKFRLTESIHAI
ncbi:acyl-CoA synthetase [Gordonia rhizosphera]|uniref:Putative acyl-CoA synthetase n=1 Tax=Gordonia rhizosphera NBRC 16068 TaxID=1108045 RepID=K6WMN6_9ACTN|nr:long-chain fatty acid--CoA ligase [Gordonia rhizosphera]GAB93387.1 putative acyl-CoA synthetase [Gordonia rhizosphera NBRC 16068]